MKCSDIKNISDLNERQQAFLLLQNQDLTKEEAAKSLGYHPKYAYQLEKKLAKFSLKDVKLIKDAHKCVKKLVKGETFGTIEKVKDSTALAAAEMVYDRVEPKVQKVETNSTSVIITADIREKAKEKLRKYYEVGGSEDKQPVLIGENEQ